MGAICNGLALDGSGLIAYGATVCFTDYMRAAIRLSLSEAGVIYHDDSIALGEDGYQPVEHLAALR